MTRLGQRLKEERIAKNLTIEEVAKATKIRPQFITAIEQSNYKKLPSKAYAQGFVKNYIAFLGLPPRDSLAMFRREFNEKEYVDILPESFTKRREIPLYRINWHKTVLGIGMIFLLLAGFLFFQYRAAIFDPSLHVSSPKENSTITDEGVSVKGSTDSNNMVTVNNYSTYVDTNGSFVKNIAVFSGKNTITIIATNRFGRKKIIERHIIVK
ncbi:MAG TPA: helix-turn-helix domain-containing protein [Candidatus Saccharimonadales bacterium]|nr:helix-turn-helix domain-containing protein [Candidatus Saccharimonadales bacterium]